MNHEPPSLEELVGVIRAARRGALLMALGVLEGIAEDYEARGTVLTRKDMPRVTREHGRTLLAMAGGARKCCAAVRQMMGEKP